MPTSRRSSGLRLIRSLSDADRQVGQLSGEGKQLPNPHLLIRPFIKREAVLSSGIEGTQATLGEFAIDRYSRAINMCFMDSSMRKVGLCKVDDKNCGTT